MLISGRVALLGAATISLEPLSSNFKAKRDIDENATYLGSAYVIKPVENSGSNMADYYVINVYKEEVNELTPLKIIGNGEAIESPTTLSYQIEDYKEETYTNTTEITTSLETTLEVKGSIPYVSEISTKISSNIGSSYSVSFTETSTNVVKKSISVYVDGVSNKFGYYVYTLCTTASYKYYLYYYHKYYSNYNQLETYQTVLFAEDSDCHIYLSSNNIYMNKLYYFSTLNEYNDFIIEWGLN